MKHCRGCGAGLVEDTSCTYDDFCCGQSGCCMHYPQAAIARTDAVHLHARFWAMLYNACTVFEVAYRSNEGRGAAEKEIRRVLRDFDERHAGDTFTHPDTARTPIIIESPYGKRPDGSACTPEEMEDNLCYFWACVRDSLRRGEAPFGSHGFYPRAGLNDAIPAERRAGIEAGFAIAEVVKRRAFYVDRGWTPGMLEARVDAANKGHHIDIRELLPEV